MIEEAVQQMLAGTPAVSAIVGNRIYPTTLPQAATLPAVTFKQVSCPSVADDNDGPGDLFRPRFEVDAWSKDYTVAVALAKAIRGIRGFRGIVGDTELQNVKLDNAQFFFEADTEIHRVSQDFFVWGKE